MNEHLNIVTLPGDGIGVEIMPLIVELANQSVERYNELHQTNLSITFHHGDMGKGAYEKFGDALPATTLLLAKEHAILFKGPTEAPEGLKSDGTQHTSVNVALRKAGDYYACVRPIFHLPNVPTNFTRPNDVNWIIFRENSEGLYGMPLLNEAESKLLIEYMAVHDTFKRVAEALRRDGEQVLQFGTISKKATRRIMKAAIEYAINHGLKNITLLHKGNIFKETDGKFLKWCKELTNEYSDQVTWWENSWKASKEEAENHFASTGKIIVDTTIIDDFFAKSQAMPQNFSVLVTENFKGDIVSDFAAGLVGGLGVAPGSNINFENGNMLLEATHGTAPDIAGKNIANPTSMILSLMFGVQQIGGTWADFAKVLQKAIEQVYHDQYMTGDLARKIDGLKPVTLSAFIVLLKMAFANCLQKKNDGGLYQRMFLWFFLINNILTLSCFHIFFKHKKPKFMNIIKAIGKALVLNTINNLVPGTKVKISINSLAFCVDGRAKLYKNAQYVSYDLPTENYIIPLTKEIDGNITLDFTEAPYAFGRYSVEEFDKLQEDWLPYEVEQEKQTSDKEYIARYSILTLSREFYDEATSEPQEKERLDFIFNVFQKKISHCYEKKTIESLFNYYKTDFISQLEKSNEFIDEQERAESIEGFKQKVEPYFTKIFKKLEKQLHKIQNTQHNENMSNDDMQTLLDKYLLDEDYANASLMRDKMKEKGYAPKS